MLKILYICDQSPFEQNYGSQQRSGLLLDALSIKGQVDLVCFTSEKLPQSIERLNCLIKYFGDLPNKDHNILVKRIYKLVNILLSFSPYSVYGKNKFASNIVHNILRTNEYDYIVIRYIKNAFMCGLLKNKHLIVDIDDLPEQSILSYIDINRLSGFKYLEYTFYAYRAKLHTDKYIRRIHHAFCSNIFQCKWQNSSYLPNIPFPHNSRFSAEKERNTKTENFTVMFIGYMVHKPNLHGVQYFLDNIWGNVQATVPNAIFKIVGKGIKPEQKAEWEKYEGVTVLGFIPDIHIEYNRCNVVVVPIYSGAGTNIKILEAMSVKRATVISEFVSKPFKHQFIDGYNIMIAKNDQDFADKIIKLLQDKNHNFNIAENGAKLIYENYNFSNFKKSVHKIII